MLRNINVKFDEVLKPANFHTIIVNVKKEIRKWDSI